MVGVAIPLVLLIIFGSIPYFNKPMASLGGYTLLDAYVPILIAFALAILSLTALPMVLASYREQGVLRRLQTTPIGPVRVLAAQLAANLHVAAVTVVLVLAVARLGYDVFLPRQLAGFVVAALLAAAALMAIGLVIAAVTPNARTAQITGALLFFPLMFFAGLWLPIPTMPTVLQHISHATPLGRRGAGPDRRGPGPLADRAAAGDAGRLRGGVRAGRGPAVPLGVRPRRAFSRFRYGGHP